MNKSSLKQILTVGFSAIFAVWSQTGAALQYAGNGGNWSLERSVKELKKQPGNRVLRAETRKNNGRSVHRIRVLDQKGRVRQIEIDPDTGRRLR